MRLFCEGELTQIKALLSGDRNRGTDASKGELHIEQAAARCGVSSRAFRDWEKHGCPWLGGKRIKLIRRRGSVKSGRRATWHTSVREEDVKAIIAGSKVSPDEFEDGGERWISARLVPLRFGIDKHTALRWHRSGCPALGGQKLEARQGILPKQGGRRAAWFFRESRLTQIKALMSGDWNRGTDASNGELHISAAAARCGVSVNTMYRWSKDGCPSFGGKRIKLIQHRVVVASGGKMVWRTYVSEANVNAIVAAQNASPDEFEDGGEKWICQRLVSQRFGITKGTAVLWHRSGCPALGGQKVRARRGRLASWGSRKDAWFFRESEFKEIFAARNGGRGGVVAVASPSPVEAIQPTGRDEPSNGNGRQGTGQGGTSQPAAAAVTHAASQEAAAIADAKTSNSRSAKAPANPNAARLFVGGLPENPDIVDLVVHLDAARGTGKSNNQVATDFYSGDKAKAKVALAQIWRYKRKGRILL
ncbi:MAG: hypothetical protein NTY19_03930 [Planctomycetota bacterium]|nr:hypothetical protein [Planctomycetota bacterium]